MEMGTWPRRNSPVRSVGAGLNENYFSRLLGCESKAVLTSALTVSWATPRTAMSPSSHTSIIPERINYPIDSRVTYTRIFQSSELTPCFTTHRPTPWVCTDLLDLDTVSLRRFSPCTHVLALLCQFHSQLCGRGHNFRLLRLVGVVPAHTSARYPVQYLGATIGVDWWKWKWKCLSCPCPNMAARGHCEPLLGEKLTRLSNQTAQYGLDQPGLR